MRVTKDPDAVLDYASDWAEWLADAETISSHTVTVETGLTKASDFATDSKVTAWLSGGTAGETYKVAFRVTTNQGRTDERTVSVAVRER